MNIFIKHIYANKVVRYTCNTLTFFADCSTCFLGNSTSTRCVRRTESGVGGRYGRCVRLQGDGPAAGSGMGTIVGLHLLHFMEEAIVVSGGRWREDALQGAPMMGSTGEVGIQGGFPKA